MSFPSSISNPVTQASRVAGAPLSRQFMGYLEENPVAETLFKDVTGYNLPRLATTRTPNEFFDTLTGELANTSITLSGTLLLPPLFQRAMSKLTGMPLAELTQQLQSHMTPSMATKMARLGSSLGYLNLWAALFWATPFFRNWLTMERSKTANFENIIGLDKDGGAIANNPEKLKQAKREQLTGMAKVIGVGAGLAAGSVGGFAALARMLKSPQGKAGLQQFLQKLKLQTQAKQLANWMHKQFDLGGAKSNQVSSRLATLIYWSLPAYFGWLQASRSQNEFKENLLKTVNSNLWFFALTPVVKQYFLKHYQAIDPNLKSVPDFKVLNAIKDGPIKDKLLALKQKDFGIGLGITVLMLATTPQLINRILTKRRFEKAQQAKANPLPNPTEAGNVSSVNTNNNGNDEPKLAGIPAHLAQQPVRSMAELGLVAESLIGHRNTLPFEWFLLNNR
jgi:hypothetical protein